MSINASSIPVNLSSAHSSTVKPKRYHPVLVTLHWLVAILMFSAVFLRPEEEHRGRRPEGGSFPPPNASQPGNFPQPGNFTPRAPSVDIHMVLGAVILVLMIGRVIVRFITKRPAWASTGNKLLDMVGELTHLALYLLIFVILLTGGILAYRDGLIAKVLGLASTSTAQGFSFDGFIFRASHSLSWGFLVLLLFLHIGAALYHQFILKDNLLGRMWFGKQTE